MAPVEITFASCPPQPFRLTRLAVPTSRAVASSDVNGKDVCAFQMIFANTTAAPITVTVDDAATSKLLTAKSIPANDTVIISFPYGEAVPGGLYWVASGAGVLGSVVGFRSL